MARIAPSVPSRAARSAHATSATRRLLGLCPIWTPSAQTGRSLPPHCPSPPAPELGHGRREIRSVAWRVVAEDDRKIPQGRLRRSAKLGGTLGSQAARYAGTKAAGLARSEEGASEKLEARHLETALKMVETLGEMK